MNKYTPKLVVDSVYDIDFVSIYNQGYNVIFFDVDNTLMKYTEKLPSIELINLFNELKRIGFSIYLITNNSSKRISLIQELLIIDGFLSRANKPKNKKIQNFASSLNIDLSKTIGIGDQLVTDILSYNRCGIYSIIVKTMDKTVQKWYTKINRIREKKIIKNIKIENEIIGKRLEEICQDV